MYLETVTTRDMINVASRYGAPSWTRRLLTGPLGARRGASRAVLTPRLRQMVGAPTMARCTAAARTVRGGNRQNNVRIQQQRVCTHEHDDNQHRRPFIPFS